MAIHISHNPYKGINAHFNSLLQDLTGGWRTFHNVHVSDLTRTLNRSLPQNYYAVSESSLQILLPDEISDSYPDVSILAREKLNLSPTTPFPVTPTLEVPTSYFFPDEDMDSAVVIYQQPDIAVTRIEVLSPSNKTTHAQEYLLMRHKTLASGLNMIELDYLHETPSPFREFLPNYTKSEADSYPYYIAIDDRDRVRFFCFHVDDPIPTLPIPLLNGESVMLDFGKAYQTTLADDRRVQFHVDYAQVPPNFERYSEEDQARIRAVMARIQAE